MKQYGINTLYLEQIKKQIEKEKECLLKVPNDQSDRIQFLNDSLHLLEYYKKGYCKTKNYSMDTTTLNDWLQYYSTIFPNSMCHFYQEIIEEILSVPFHEKRICPKEKPISVSTSLNHSITFYNKIHPTFYQKAFSLVSDPQGFITVRPNKKDTKFFTYFPTSTVNLPYAKYPFIHLTTEKSAAFFECKCVHELGHAIDIMNTSLELPYNIFSECNPIISEFLFDIEKMKTNVDFAFLLQNRVRSIVEKCYHVKDFFALLQDYQNHYFYTIDDFAFFCEKRDLSYSGIVEDINESVFCNDLVYIISYLKALQILEKKKVYPKMQEIQSILSRRIGLYDITQLFAYDLDQTKEIGLKGHKKLCYEMF